MNTLASLDWKLELLSWSAWAPGLENRTDWRDWLRRGGAPPENVQGITPKAASVPPRLRRRCSAAGKMALETGLKVCEQAGISGDDVNLIYCSRNGEIITLKALFDDLYFNEPLSPTQFSNSVHHTPTGYFSLITKNQRISRTVSGGEDCFACGLLECISLQPKDPERPILMLYGDEFAPEPFDVLLEKPEFPFSVALLFQNGAGGTALNASLDQQILPPEPFEHERDPVFSFLAWLELDRGDYQLETTFGRMTWKR